MCRRSVALALALASGCGRVGFDRPSATSDAVVDVPSPFDACGVAARTWNLVPDGDFESELFATWTLYDEPNGLAVQTQSPVVAGANAVRMTPTQSGFRGYAIGVDIPVTAGSYVLSGFLNAEQILADQSFYLDLDDVPFEPNVQTTLAAPGWQFVYQTVAVPLGVAMVRVRVVHDGMINIAQAGFADEIGFTPAATFSPFVPCL